MVDIIPSGSNMSISQVKTRRAKFVAVLTYYDGPQLILLRNTKQRFLGIAIPRQEATGFDFFVTSVQGGHWEQYKAGKFSLRYLFIFPEKRSLFYFDSRKISTKKEIVMTRFDGEINPDHLPGEKLFAADHTETDYEEDAGSVEKLLLDGNWDLPELGKFQQHISDVYNFMYSMGDWRKSTEELEREAIRKVFVTRPFEGGSSYGAYFNDLEKRLRIGERVKLKAIEKASPGYMNIGGSEEVFSEVEDVIRSYIQNRTELKNLSNEIVKYLRKEKLATMVVERFSYHDARSIKLDAFSSKVCELINLSVLEELNAMTKKNALGTLKIVMAIYRRASNAAEYFAQGRADFG